MKQDYPENVIVTIRTKKPKREMDVRLPSDGMFQNWIQELISILNKYYEAQLDPCRVSVFYNGRKLQPTDTLASLGAWDGSILQLEGR